MMEMVRGWFHAEVDLDRFLKHVGAFLDMLILASGYQSNGSPAVWTSGSLQRALDWACYLEEVLDSLPAGKRGDESKDMLNVKLQMVFKNGALPPGMTNISSAELEKARRLLVQVLVRGLPVENAWLTASVVQECDDVSLKEVVIREISQRCMATGCVKSLQLASELAAQVLKYSRRSDANDADIWQTPQATPGESCWFSVCRTGLYDPQKIPLLLLDSSHSFVACFGSGLKSGEFKEWVYEGLVYIMCAETIHKLSGATLIFSAGRTQWIQVLESLLRQADSGLACIRAEIAELCCFFLASSRWKCLPKKILHLSCKSSTNLVSLEDCWLGKEPTLSHGSGESFAYKSQEVEEYLRQLFCLEKDLWLQLHPILLAVALAESSLLEDYVRYIGDRMLNRASECPGKCTCDICRRRKDARERSWWVLMLHRPGGVDIGS